MPAPSIMAVWQGTGPGSFGDVDVWKHQITLFLRARETFDGDPPTAVLPAVPVDHEGRSRREPAWRWTNATVHPSCHPMDLPSIQRQTDAEGLDYFEVPITFTEIGDE